MFDFFTTKENELPNEELMHDKRLNNVIYSTDSQFAIL